MKSTQVKIKIPPIISLVPLLMGLLLCPLVAYSEETVKIKILAVNPSATQTLNTDVVHALPQEIKPEDVIDSAGMEIVYDNEKNTYLLTSKMELQPKEKRSLEVKVRNVWVISDEYISEIRSAIEADIKALQGTKYQETAQLLFDKAVERITQIEEENAQSLGIRQQIELYRAHMKQLTEIRSGILSMESLRQMEAQSGEEFPTASFIITAENPSQQARTMTVRAELPKDVKSQDIVDKQDFVTLYDADRSRFILEKSDEFAPLEVKQYTIVIRDIWYIPGNELSLLREQTQKLTELFKETPYETYATQGTDWVINTIDEIQQLQTDLAGASIDEKMRAFVLNSQKLKLAQKKVRELQDLVLELPLKRQDETIIDKVFRGVKEIQKIADVSKIFSMGVNPETSTTWWIIFGIIIFLAILASIFYVTWLKKLKNDPFSKHSTKATSDTQNDAIPEPEKVNQE